jgi:AmmeMemoRadiSam system protein A
LFWDDRAEQAGEILNIEEVQPTAAQQQAMLLMARQAIAAALNKEPPPPVTDDPFFAYRAGAFVTLREKRRFRESGPGQLRGCIGHMQADQPLRQVVPEMAVEAATGDPRFPPMKPSELKGVTIEIAILSQITPVESKDDIDIGRHGLVLTGDWRRALLLPETPHLYGWDLEQYLANLHRKAGLPTGYWPEKGKLYSFTSFDFGE